MRITIDITDEKQLEQFEALRGETSPEQFAAVCFEQGMKVAEFQRRQSIEAGKHPLLQFPETKPEFRTVEGAEIAAALKEKNQENPLVIEVSRLVNAYMAQLSTFAKQNGNRLPPALQVRTATPIQKVACEITLGAVRNMIEGSSRKTAAAA